METAEEVELATLTWVHSHNIKRLHRYLRDVTPAEFKATFYTEIRRPKELADIE
jgi:putative transposase